MKKRFISAFLAVMLCFAMAGSALAVRDMHYEEYHAYLLESLGLFKGVGTKADGSTDFALYNTPSRIEAIVMLIRLKGEEPAALAYDYDHSFTDVDPWADPYVGWAYKMGYTKGYPDGRFGSGDVASPAMFITFVLRALGFSDTIANPDFVWDNPYALAEQLRLTTTKEVNLENFVRGDMAVISWNALMARPKYSGHEGMTLGEVLLNAGVFTQIEWDYAMLNADFCPYDLYMHDSVAIGTFYCYRDGNFVYEEQWRPKITLFEDNTFELYSNMGEGFYLGLGSWYTTESDEGYLFLHLDVEDTTIWYGDTHIIFRIWGENGAELELMEQLHVTGKGAYFGHESL